MEIQEVQSTLIEFATGFARAYKNAPAIHRKRCTSYESKAAEEYDTKQALRQENLEDDAFNEAREGVC